MSVLAEYGFMPAIIVSRLELTRAHIREAADLLREGEGAQFNLASSLGAPRSKSRDRGRLTPTRCPSGELRAAGPPLHMLTRFILTAQALVEGGEVGFFADAMCAN